MTINNTVAVPFRRLINKVSHGFVMPANNVPIPVHLNNNGSHDLSDASVPSKQSTEFIVEVLDADNYIVQCSGYLKANSHSLTLGDIYYVDPADAGSVTSILPSSPNYIDPCIKVISPDLLLLLNTQKNQA